MFERICIIAGIVIGGYIIFYAICALNAWIAAGMS